MNNALFKEYVDALFEKTALGRDPREVLTELPEGQRGHLRRGLALIESAKGTAEGVKNLAGTVGRGIDKFLSPASNESGVLARGLQGAHGFLSKRPRLAGAAIGTAFLAPILGKAFDASQRQNEEELMNAYADPTRVITASLDKFLEKKAELHSMTKEAATPSFQIPPAVRAQRRKDLAAVARAASRAVKRSLPPEPTFWESSQKNVVEGLGKGLGQSAGGALVSLMAHGIGTSFDALRDHFMVEPRRKALFETLLKSDPVLSDAISRNPEAKSMLKESYGTMVRFAPTLSLDVNAVRSFLREAVLGGSGVNYATIKNLVDTERSIADARPTYGGH